MNKKHYDYQARTNTHHTPMMRHSGTYEGSLLKARNIARSTFPSEKQCLVLTIRDVRTGEKTEIKVI